jgi:hypothetical protein
MIFERGEFDDFAQKFSADGDTRVAQQSTGRQAVTREFEVDAAMLDDFKAHLIAENITIDEKAFEQDREFVRAMIRLRIDEAVFGQSEGRRRLIAADPQAQLGVSMLGEAATLGGLVRGATPAQ